MNILDMKCKKCGVSFRRQALFALAIDAGAKTSDPCLCPKGGDHEFVDEEKPQIEKQGSQV